jgi:CheY-like chemotaxis protein
LDMQMPEMNGLELATEIHNRSGYNSLPLVMLTAFGRCNEIRKSSMAHFVNCLSKPIKASLLYDALISVIDSKPDQGKQTYIELIIDGKLAERLPLRILIAEDSVVNQKVALGMLKRLGYRADVAANGQEVIEGLHRQFYDVIFMDIQMPNMDGLESTREIRRLWPALGPHIIAMTANAMSGDRERCLESGMDDYVSKPVRMEALQAALERCGNQVLEQVDETAKSQPDLIDPTILATLRELSEGGEPDFLTGLVELFFRDANVRLEELAEAIAQHDPVMLRRAAHTLKGTSANMGANRMEELCSEIEKKGKSGTIREATQLINELSVAFCCTRRALEAEMSVS